MAGGWVRACELAVRQWRRARGTKGMTRRGGADKGDDKEDGGDNGGGKGEEGGEEGGGKEGGTGCDKGLAGSSDAPQQPPTMQEG